MTPPKIIFLDCDGVLNCKETIERHEGYIGLDPVRVERFKQIVKQTEAGVVLSSTWRLTESWRQAVRDAGIMFIDITPDLRGQKRGDEINEWLSLHPEIKQYAIIDDDPDFYLNQFLFQTTWEEGLTEDIAARVIEFLK